MAERRLTAKEVLEKYGAKLESQVKTSSVASGGGYSKSYSEFKGEMAPEFNRYEKWANSLGRFIRVKISDKDSADLQKSLDVAHLDIEPWQAMGLAMMTFLSTFVFGMIISVAIALISLNGGSFSVDSLVENFPFLLLFLIVLSSLFLFYFVKGIPQRMANKWRLKASSQMVPAILYIVVYMRHTPNLEKAVAFASEHLQPPLSLDFKKVFYNVQVGKFSTIKESLDNYLDGWRDYAPGFIEAFHLIESSLFEPDNSRRIATLEKSLQVVLDSVYDKMLKFTHNVRAPLTNVYMLGVVLPTLALALLPLASVMVGGIINWMHVFILFNLIVPLAVFYLTDKIMFLRPGGHGETTLLEKNPLYPKYASKKPYYKAFFICLPLFIIGILPLLFQSVIFLSVTGLQPDYTLASFGFESLSGEWIFDFKDYSTSETITTTEQLKSAKNSNTNLVGPFGFGALVFGMFFPLGLALFFVLSFGQRTKELIIERERTKDLENEFNNSLFQLGNRIGNGVPPELVFGKVAESSKGLMTEDFFRRVNYNIQQMGMSVEKAIFDPRRGAMNYYPSDLIATSMRVLVESSKKGLKIAAVSLMSISEYVKNINKISARLRDMLAEIISDMKSNMTFLAPLLAGVVVGLSGMITAILNKLNLPEVEAGAATGAGGVGDIVQLFQIIHMIPPYYLQIAIGVYLIQIIFILTGTLVMIDSGEDKLEKTNKISKNLKSGMLLYFIVALFSTMSLFILASVVLKGVF